MIKILLISMLFAVISGTGVGFLLWKIKQRSNWIFVLVGLPVLLVGFFSPLLVFFYLIGNSGLFDPQSELHSAGLIFGSLFIIASFAGGLEELWPWVKDFRFRQKWGFSHITWKKY